MEDVCNKKQNKQKTSFPPLNSNYNYLLPLDKFKSLAPQKTHPS